MKKAIIGTILGLSLFGFSASGITTAQASRTSVVRYTNIRDAKVHVAKGTMYTSAKLSKTAHYAKNYKYTTFTKTEQATVKKNGKKAVYQYIKAGKIKGWIWHGYVKNGKASNGVLKYTNIKDTKAHVSKGTLFTTAKLSKVAHYGKNYKSTTFTRTEQAKVRKTDGKTYTYQYIKSNKASGWIWSGYVKAGNAPRSFSSYRAAFQDYIQGTGLASTIYTQNDLQDIAVQLENYGSGWNIDESYNGTQKDLAAFENIYNLFKSRFSSSQRTHFTSMINKTKAEKASSADDNDAIKSDLGQLSNALGEAVAAFK